MATTTSLLTPRPVLAAPLAPELPARVRALRPSPAVVRATDLLAATAGTLLVQLPSPPPEPAVLLGVPVIWWFLLTWTSVPRAGLLLGLVGTLLATTGPAAVPPGRMLLLTLGLVAVALGTRHLAAAGGTRVVLVGDPTALDAASTELDRPGSRFAVVDQVPTGPGAVLAAGALADVAGHRSADAVLVLPGAGLDAAALRRLGWELEGHGVELYVGTGLLDVCAARTSSTRAGGLGLVHVRRTVHAGPGRLVKAVAERVVAAGSLLLLGPLLLALLFVVRLSSPGPALFRQTRIGRDGQPFTMLKLRTMTIGDERPHAELLARNEVGGGVLFKLREDPRVTRVGRVLRRYSLDELPQLVNVLRGDMALVGPRPALPREVEAYAADPRRRLVVRPGLTGLWQVSGRSDLSWEETVRLDLSYVDNWSLGLDLWIAARTVRAVLGHRGAY